MQAPLTYDIDELVLRSRQNVEGVLGGIGFDHILNIWIFAAAFVILAYAAWRCNYPEERNGSFLAFLFPARIYRHDSFRADIMLFLVNKLTSPLSFASAAFLGSWLASGTSGALSRLFGWDARFEATLVEIAGFTLCLALVSDFATYAVHRLHHRIPALWEIHKVHHSAEVLSPLTAFRKHPVYDLIGRTIKALLTGPLQGGVFFLFAGPVDALTVLGANLVFGIFHLIGGSLRHSHVWLSYGPALEHLLISPAQHQIHHSRARHHWDKNFGEIFAIWDWLFGTLYVPRGREHLEFGVDDLPARAHSGLVNGCLRPLGAALAVIIGRHSRR